MAWLGNLGLLVGIASVTLNVIQFFLQRYQKRFMLSQCQFLVFIHEATDYQVSLYINHSRSPKYGQSANFLSKCSTISGYARAGKYQIEALARLLVNFAIDKRLKESTSNKAVQIEPINGVTDNSS